MRHFQKSAGAIKPRSSGVYPSISLVAEPLLAIANCSIYFILQRPALRPQFFANFQLMFRQYTRITAPLQTG